MKRISFLVLAGLLASGAASAQDSELEQRFKELNGRIDSYMESLDAQRKQISELQREIEHLREQQNKPVVPSATQEDLKRVAHAVEEVDRKRLEDYDKIREEIKRLGKSVTAQLSTPPPRSSPPPSRESTREKDSAKDTSPETGYEYEVQQGDTLSLIIKACRAKGVKITQDQILKANPGLKPERLLPKQKIFIPAPKP